MLRIEAFTWTNETQEPFEALKTAMAITPVLWLPNFSKPFTIETYVSSGGIEAVYLGWAPFSLN